MHLFKRSSSHEMILLTTSSALSFIIYACRFILGGMATNTLGHPTHTVCTEISAVCKFRGFRSHLLIQRNLIRENLLVCNNWRFVTVHNMLPFHDEPVIRENIIAKILFASCSAKISYRENFHVYGIAFVAYCS